MDLNCYRAFGPRSPMLFGRSWVWLFVVGLIFLLVCEGALPAFSGQFATKHHVATTSRSKGKPVSKNRRARQSPQRSERARLRKKHQSRKKRQIQAARSGHKKTSHRRQTKRNHRSLIVIDAGHGGKDPGAIAGGLIEKELTLVIAKLLQKELRRRGIRTALTRNTDQELSLKERLRRTATLRPDLFVSLHVNASHSPASRGIETFAYLPTRLRPGKKCRIPLADAPGITTRSARLAQAVQQGLMHTLGARGWHDGGPRLGRFAVLRQSVCPSLLIELGYLTNKHDARKLHSSAMRRKMAVTLARQLSKLTTH